MTSDGETDIDVCATCGTRLPVNETPRRPCPTCGGVVRSMSRSASDSSNFSDSASVTTSAIRAASDAVSVSERSSWTARSENSVRARVRRLEDAIDDVAVGIESGTVAATQDATKRALEVVHELDDAARERNEWEQVDWAEDDVGVWEALVGARNASHHSSSIVVELHSDGDADSRLRWAVNAEKIRGQRKREEYESRLAGQPVIPPLRRVLASLKAGASEDV